MKHWGSLLEHTRCPALFISIAKLICSAWKIGHNNLVVPGLLSQHVISSGRNWFYGLHYLCVVPGEFFPYDSTADQSHAESLRRIVRDLAPCRPSKQHQHTTTYVPAELKSSDYVFIREDAHKPPLSNPYRGPYRVLARTDKSYCVQLDNREDWISIDRLKPAYLDVDDHNRDVVTRSGRTSRPPLRFDIMSHSNRGGM